MYLCRGTLGLSRLGEPGFLEVGGVRLEARWTGPPPEAAPTLVFLHEGLGSTSLWRGFPDRVAHEPGGGGPVFSRGRDGQSAPRSPPRPLRLLPHEADSPAPSPCPRPAASCPARRGSPPGPRRRRGSGSPS